MPVLPKTYPEQETYDLVSAAKVAGISTRHIRELERDGRLPFRSIRIGRRVLVPKKSFHQFLDGDDEEFGSKKSQFT